MFVTKLLMVKNYFSHNGVGTYTLKFISQHMIKENAQVLGKEITTA